MYAIPASYRVSHVGRSALPEPPRACEGVTLTDWYTSSLPVCGALLQPLKACEGLALAGWYTSSSPVGRALLQPLKALENMGVA